MTHQIRIAAALLAMSLGFASAVSAETITVSEDFTSLAQADTNLTNADWNITEGVLKLHGQGLAEISSAAVGGLAYASVWKDDHLLVGNHTGSALVVVDVTTATTPTVVNSQVMPGNARNVMLSGDWAYVSLGNGLGVQLVNVANVLTPVLGTNVNLGSYTGEAVLHNTWLYTASYAGGVGAIEVTDPASPVAMPLVDLAAWVRGVAVQGSHLYLATESAMTVMSLASPAVPDSVAVVPISGSSLCLTTAGNWAYVGGLGGLDIVDITQPTDPQVISNLPFEGGAVYHVAVQGDSLFVANGTDGLKIVDVSNPAQPEVLGEFYSPDYFYHTLLNGGHAYASNGAGGLLVLQADAQGLDAERNLAVSADLNPSGEPILRARLSAVYSDSIRFEITNNGATWFDIPPDDSWFDFELQGTSLKWRASLIQAGPYPGPICDNLVVTFDRAHSYAEILSAADVPGDTGGQVRLVWNASRFDAAGEAELVNEYSVYRRYDPTKAAYPPGDWEYLLTVPADQEAIYAVSVPTLADSSNLGTNWATYFVRSRTSNAGTFYDSPPDSGYSLNNLAPAPPANFVVQREAGGVQLTWDAYADPDFAHFRIYRVLTPWALPSPATLLEVTTSTSHYDLTSDLWFYQLTAVNLMGIESAPAPHPSAVSDLPGGGILLAQNSPNPFNPSTRIAYSVPVGGRKVRLEVYDIRGLLVKVLVDEFAAAGLYNVNWLGRDADGRTVASGIYTCRLRCGDRTTKMKMTLVR